MPPQPFQSQAYQQWLDYCKRKNFTSITVIIDNDSNNISDSGGAFIKEAYSHLGKKIRTDEESWRPRKTIPRPKMPLSALIKSKTITEVKAYATWVMKCFKKDSQKYGDGVCGIWETNVDVKELVLTEHILKAAGFKEDEISREKIIPWESLKSFKGMSRGPEKSLLKYKISWVNCVRILLELVFRKLDLDTESYTQQEIEVQRGNDHIDNDFEISEEEEIREEFQQQQSERLQYVEDNEDDGGRRGGEFESSSGQRSLVHHLQPQASESVHLFQFGRSAGALPPPGPPLLPGPTLQLGPSLPPVLMAIMKFQYSE